MGCALGLMLLCAGGLEASLARKGFRPSLADSLPLWERQRQRVDHLGSHALILVGNSRMLADMDLQELRRDSGFEPVQLAVGGASFLPVLEDLAKDSAVTGTVLVNFEPQELRVSPLDPAASYVASQGPAQGDEAWDFAGIEAALSDQWHLRLRSYADGSRPLSALLLRATDPDPVKQYVTTLPDREQAADFTLAEMPRAYYVRAIHEFRMPPPLPPHAGPQQQQAAIERAITTLGSDDFETFREQFAALAGLVTAIQGHGGRVMFIRLPRSGYVREIDDRRFPRRLFWEPLASLSGVQTLNFEDVPALRGFSCPDGSHLDMRDKARFTRVLVDSLHLDSAGP